MELKGSSALLPDPFKLVTVLCQTENATKLDDTERIIPKWPKLSMLKHDSVYILDCWTEMFVWFGRSSDETLRSVAIQISNALSQARHAEVGQMSSPVKVIDGAEPFLFRVKFLDWADLKHYKMADCSTPQGFCIATRHVSSSRHLPSESVRQKLTESLQREFGMYIDSTFDTFIKEAGIPNDVDDGIIKIYQMDGTTFNSISDTRYCGHFQSNKSYAVYFKANASRAYSEKSQKHDFELLYFWSGLDAPKKDKLLWGLDPDVLNWKTIKWGSDVPVLKISQGLEPVHFRQLFQTSSLGRLCYHTPALKVEDGMFTTVLYEVRGLLGDHFQVSQVHLSLASLCSQTVSFCIRFQNTESSPNCQDGIHQEKVPTRFGEAWFWVGRLVSYSLLQHAGDVSMLLLEYYQLPANTKINILQEAELDGTSSQEVWTNLIALLAQNAPGTNGSRPCLLVGDQESRPYFPAQLYVTDRASGDIQLQKHSFFIQDTLHQQDAGVAILDAWEAVYLWSLTNAPVDTKQMVSQAVQEYISKGTDDHREVVIVDESTHPPPAFCSHFTNWKCFSGFADPYTVRYHDLVSTGKIGEAVLGRVLSEIPAGIHNISPELASQKQKHPSDIVNPSSKSDKDTASKEFLTKWKEKMDRRPHTTNSNKVTLDKTRFAKKGFDHHKQKDIQRSFGYESGKCVKNESSCFDASSISSPFQILDHRQNDQRNILISSSTVSNRSSLLDTTSIVQRGTMQQDEEEEVEEKEEDVPNYYPATKSCYENVNKSLIQKQSVGQTEVIQHAGDFSQKSPQSPSAKIFPSLSIMEGELSSNEIDEFLRFNMESGYSNEDLKYFLRNFSTLEAGDRNFIWLKLQYYHQNVLHSLSNSSSTTNSL